ncbi:granulin a isoform X1 [Triplophysa dalaica]|uniref:granulin a isoform X1 n=1 Tax=Triplophysa dalaica TaxID=1582913 RepID=UPI0024DFFC09|nr:granulin a isoform X1 [Triplophysa dalaica]XP_056608957.1 granulin a isoform X1 [Triplophysa dalaica]
MFKLSVGFALVTLVACLQCPSDDGCEAGQTCCQAPNGDVSCCPYHHGECCEDHLHCCPEGMMCQVMESVCQNATHSLPWVERMEVEQTSLPKSFRMIPSLPASESEITCLDGSYCPAEFSCLLMSTSYGCCPVAQGIVCWDGKHCCPKGHECSADSSSCVKHKADETVLCGDGNSECPVDTTCCETEVDGQWACCPMPKAVCCDDKVHCCPEDSICDVQSSKCLSSTNQDLPMWAKFPARLRAEWEDHRPAAVVTPEMSTEAEPTTNQITTALSQEEFLEMTMYSGFNVPCNDTAACADNTTCCKTKDGGWACCPLPEAVCCDDFIHCCPHGQTCDVAAGSCDGLLGSVPWYEKFPVQPISTKNMAKSKNSNVPCNDTAACPDNSTCCKTKDGGWACCPLPEAVCCDDFIHCCPHGQTCDVAAGSCDGLLGSVPWYEKFPVQPISTQNMAKTKNSNVPCNDTAACADNTTCCKTKDGGWACCPLPEAVCCDDFIHCCPHGQTCDVAAGSCDGLSGSVPWYEKFPVQPISTQNMAKTKNSNVPCNDTAACADNTTCCKTKDGGWACCPLPEAVCCDDFIHCCPHGQTCDVAAGSCDGLSGSVPWYEKFPVQPISTQNMAKTKNSNVPCNDTAACADNTTCCKTKDGGWACCPLPEAVCCDDFIHCCPHGQTCDVAAGSCNGLLGSVPWYEKFPVQPISTKNMDDTKKFNVPCNDTAACPDNSTCCKTKDGGWACCPLPEAVCCDDFVHCCPHGQTCDVAAATCSGPSGSMSWFEKFPVQPISTQNLALTQDVSCDSSHICPESNTCCKNIDGDWNCCPMPEAVCCSDGEHCCPTGYKCDVSKVSCIQDDVVIPWYNKITAQSTPAPSAGSVSCDEKFSCSTGSTCCRMFTGEWGCCPITEAVCCPDHEHCCPKGYTCDLGGSSCVKNLWVQVDRVPLTQIGDKKTQKINSAEDIQCGDEYSCPGGETCCPNSETSWACCPYAKAVCCDDMKHCCPAGYKCGDDSTCIKASGPKWSSWSVFFQKKKFEMSV